MAFSTLGMVDVVFGSLATLIASLLTYFLRKITVKGFPILSFIPPILINAIIVGLELRIFVADVFSSFLWAAFIVGIGELVVVIVLGVPLYYLIKKTPTFNRFFN